MNGVFVVFKDMIPACEGVEMHKLDILRAGIEYVRYLKGCVDQMDGANEKRRGQDDGGRSKVKGKEAEERFELD